MKKNKIWFFSFLILLAGLFVMFTFVPVNADTGWDSDYDSGSSYDSGSDYDWDFDRDSGSYHKSGSNSSNTCADGDKACEVFMTAVSSFIFIICIVLISIGTVDFFPVFIYDITRLFKKKNNVSNHIIQQKSGYYDEEINNILPGCTEKSVLDELYKIFVEIQKAWMNFDYDKLEKLCVSELFESYRSDLEVLKLKKGQNIMSDFAFEEGYINSIKNVDDKVIFNISLTVKFIDYVINTETKKTIRGKKTIPICNTYSLTYVINKDSTKANICPNCGAEVEGKKCSYCNSTVKEKYHHFMLSKKSKS